MELVKYGLSQVNFPKDGQEVIMDPEGTGQYHDYCATIVFSFMT